MEKELNEAWRDLESDRENKFFLERYKRLLDRKADTKYRFMFIAEISFVLNSGKSGVGMLFLPCDSIGTLHQEKTCDKLDFIIKSKLYGPFQLDLSHGNCHFTYDSSLPRCPTYTYLESTDHTILHKEGKRYTPIKMTGHSNIVSVLNFSISLHKEGLNQMLRCYHEDISTIS